MFFFLHWASFFVMLVNFSKISLLYSWYIKPACSFTNTWGKKTKQSENGNKMTRVSQMYFVHMSYGSFSDCDSFFSSSVVMSSGLDVFGKRSRVVLAAGAAAGGNRTAL